MRYKKLKNKKKEQLFIQNFKIKAFPLCFT